jgi:hypothetical protein
MYREIYAMWEEAIEEMDAEEKEVFAKEVLVSGENGIEKIAERASSRVIKNLAKEMMATPDMVKKQEIANRINKIKVFKDPVESLKAMFQYPSGMFHPTKGINPTRAVAQHLNWSKGFEPATNKQIMNSLQSQNIQRAVQRIKGF